MNDVQHADAEIATTIFIGKWTVEVLYLLGEQPHRHGQLRRRLGNISQRMLTRTLRNLESAGLISREVTRSKSVAVEYSLTKLGKTFIVPLRSICRWADRHGKHLNATIQLSKRGRDSRDLMPF
jgi:DNA-binding HxlR family transcriptional regulator